MNLIRYISLIIAIIPFIVRANVVSTDSSHVSIDLPVFEDGIGITQRIWYNNVKDTPLHIHIISRYKRTSSDTILLYDALFEVKKLRSTNGFVDVVFNKSLSMRNTNESFIDIVKRFNTVPAGVYIIQIEMLGSGPDRPLLFRKELMQLVDSTLSPGSGLRSKLNSALLNRKQINTSSFSRTKSTPIVDLNAVHNRLKRSIRKERNLTLRPATYAGKVYSEAWFKEFFLGRYELGSAQELNERAQKESDLINSDASSLVSTDLEHFRGVGSQLRELNKLKHKDGTIRANIDLSTYASSSQDPQSVQDQNYIDLLGNLDLEVFGLPCSVEGYYTTQDRNRKAKASYLRFHYDIATAKNRLRDNLSGYRNKLDESISKGQGMSTIYGAYVQKLDQEKEQMVQKVAKDYDVDPSSVLSSEGDAGKLLDRLPADSSSDSTVKLRREQLRNRKKEFSESYKRIEETQHKADKYRKLIEQYNTRNRLDSLAAYRKISNLDDKDPTYKDLSKAASGLLPEGKAKRFVTGLTRFDAGIINQYESRYTQSGQVIKGVSMGYDVGLFTAGISAGNTEYISRQGTVDQYSTLLLRVDNKGSRNHKFGFLYNINTPAKSMGIDEKFIGSQNIRYPGFSQPSNIVSLVYEGKAGKYFSAHSEVATSIRKGQATAFDMAHSALNNTVSFRIPRTPMQLNAGWEHLGASFENNTLPYIRCGTERYTLGAATTLMHGFIGLKADYNLLSQQNFTNRSTNRKWGFEFRTNTKRYPTVMLSYKPFSTFRTVNDTFSIPQRPVQGEVWTARSSYQFKRGKRLHRFTLTYNQNNSTTDTLRYHSTTLQANYIYSYTGISLNIGTGRLTLPVNFNDGTGEQSSYIANIGLTKSVGKYVTVNISPDAAFTNWGIQRLSGTAGATFAFPRRLIAFRMALRYSGYRMKADDDPIEIFAGQVGMRWQFVPKRNKRKSELQESKNNSTQR